MNNDDREILWEHLGYKDEEWIELKDQICKEFLGVNHI